MRKYSLYTLLFGALAFLGLTISATLYFSIQKERKELVKTAVSEKINLAEAINETVFSSAWKFRVSSIPGIENLFIGQMAKAKDVVYIKIIGMDGAIRLSSLKDEVGEIIKDADIGKALSSQETVVKNGFFDGKEIKLIIYPTQSNNVIFIGFSLQSIKDIIARTTMQSVILGTGSLIFILLVLFFVFRSITNPVKKIIAVCREISKGNLSVKISVKSKNEIGELADTFNETINNLRKSYAALDEAKTVLEIRVLARTKELKELTESLENKVEERTRELKVRLEELERFQKLTVGRELKMIELKKELKRASKKTKKNYGS